MKYGKLLLKNLRLSVMDNSSAYAFSTMVTGSFSLLNTIEKPQPLWIFAGAAGAVCAFMVADLVALVLLKDMQDDQSENTRLIGRLLSIVSVGFGMAAAYVSGLLLVGWISWLAAGFAASLLFIFLEGLELAVAEGRKSSHR